MRFIKKINCILKYYIKLNNSSKGKNKKHKFIAILSILNCLRRGLIFLIGTQTVLLLCLVWTVHNFFGNFFRTIWICNGCRFYCRCFTISTFLVNTYIVFVTVLVDFEIPPDPPNEELLNILELRPPPKPLPNPPEKKSSLSNIEKDPNLPFLPFFPKKALNKSSSPLLSKPTSSKKCLKISSALWKLKLVPWFGASNPYLSYAFRLF